MDSVPADPVRIILRHLRYEVIPGSNSPTTEYWISPEGVPCFFTYFRHGDRDAFVEDSVRNFLMALSADSVSKLIILLEK